MTFDASRPLDKDNFPKGFKWMVHILLSHVGVVVVVNGEIYMFETEKENGKNVAKAIKIGDVTDKKLETIKDINDVIAFLKNIAPNYRMSAPWLVPDSVSMTYRALYNARDAWNAEGHGYAWYNPDPNARSNNCYAFRSFLIDRFQLTGYDAALPR